MAVSAVYIYYWMLIAVILPALAFPKKFKSFKLVYIVIVPIAYTVVVFLFRDFNKSNDYQNYLYIYSEVNSFSEVFSRNGELLFNLFLIAGNILGASYGVVYSLLLLTSLLSLSVALYFSNLKLDEKLILIIMFFSCSGTYFLLANAFRQGLALNLMMIAIIASSNRMRMIAIGFAPIFHFSSLLPIMSITIKRFLKSKFALILSIIAVIAFLPLMQMLLIYRFEKYTDEYDYESSFQVIRLFIDIAALLFIIIYKNKFSDITTPMSFFIFKIISYNFSPLIYSRISYYDIVVYCFMYLNCQVRNKSRVKILIVVLSLLYANIIFSIESLSSNFLYINEIS